MTSLEVCSKMVNYSHRLCYSTVSHEQVNIIDGVEAQQRRGQKFFILIELLLITPLKNIKYRKSVAADLKMKISLSIMVWLE